METETRTPENQAMNKPMNYNHFKEKHEAYVASMTDEELSYLVAVIHDRERLCIPAWFTKSWVESIVGEDEDIPDEEWQLFLSDVEEWAAELMPNQLRDWWQFYLECR
jgi:hypothetical protein